MGQPVKLSDNLVLDARVAGEPAERSIAGQIEYWARLGRASNPAAGGRALRLKQRGATRPLSECLAAVDTEAGRERTAAHLAGRPYPALRGGAWPAGLRRQDRRRRHAHRRAFRGPEFHPASPQVTSPFDARPIIVAVAGPNGAGKSTFYHAHLAPAGLRFVNADDLALQLEVDTYEAASLAGRLRATLVEQRESFAFETVFSDPVGDKVAFLRDAATPATPWSCASSASTAPR